MDDQATQGDGARPRTRYSTASGTIEAAPRARKRAEVLARRIVQDVIRLGLDPGQVLPSEAEMISTYVVGRATLREALRLLEVQGLITVKPGPGGGPVLAQLTPKHFGDMAKLHLRMAGATYGELVRARLALEPLMARLAAETQDPQGLARLREVVAQSHDVPLDDDAAYGAMSQAFHAAIASMSGNRVLDLLGEALKEVMDSGVHPGFSPPELREQVHEVHTRIAEAVDAERGEEAERLMRDHMEQFVSFVEQNRPGFLDEPIEWD